MSFVDDIVLQLEGARDTSVLWELHDQEETGKVSWGVTGPVLLKRIAQARTLLAAKDLQNGDRIALLAHNSIEWVAMDLAIMAQGLIVVPLYARQAPMEVVAMMKDCSPALICCGDTGLRDGIVENWPDAPPQVLLEDVFTGRECRRGEGKSPPFAKNAKDGAPGRRTAC